MLQRQRAILNQRPILDPGPRLQPIPRLRPSVGLGLDTEQDRSYIAKSAYLRARNSYFQAIKEGQKRPLELLPRERGP